jgi:hypothetical protein
MLPTILLALLLAQYPAGQYPQQRRIPPGQNVPETRGTITDAVASFDGIFKAVDKKYVFIETEDGQILRMYLTGSTKFYRDDKQVKAADFHSGDKVTADASRDAHMNLLAVKVTAVAQRATPKRDSDK